MFEAQNKKKILFIVPSFMRGGMENMLVNIANVVAEVHDVTIYNLGSHDEGMVLRLNQRIHYYEHWMPCKNLIKHLDLGITGSSFRILPLSLWYKIHSSRYIHKKMVNEYFDTEIAFFVGEPVKIIAGADEIIKKLFWIHSDYKECSGLFNAFANRNSAIKDFHFFDNVVCVSKQAQKSFQEITGLYNTTVIYNYLNSDMIIKKSKEYSIEKRTVFSIVAVGRLVRAKGFDRLLLAASRLEREGYTFDITIVGDGAERDNLLSIIESEGLSNITLTGMLENPYPYIANADLLVCSSLYEGYNLTVAEAIILGTPVLSTDCTGPNEILDHGMYGKIVENSKEGIYNGLRELVESSELLFEYKKKAKARADFFDEGRIRKQIWEVI